MTQPIRQVGTDDTTYPNEEYSVVITAGTETSHVRAVKIQVCSYGTAVARKVPLVIIPSATATGAADNTNNTITLTSEGSGVLTKPQDSGSLDILAETGTDGLLELDLTQSSATGTRYLRVYINNRVFVSDAIAFTGTF